MREKNSGKLWKFVDRFIYIFFYLIFFFFYKKLRNSESLGILPTNNDSLCHFCLLNFDEAERASP
jgi:hypothetical protein